MNKYEMIEEIAVGEITIGKAKQLYELLEKHFQDKYCDAVTKKCDECGGLSLHNTINAIRGNK